MGSILCLFVLISISYQPIIAEEQIDNVVSLSKSNSYIRDIEELKVIYNKLVELKTQQNDDCDCATDDN